MKFEPNHKFFVSTNIVFRKRANDNYVLLDIEGDNLYETEPVSSFIWQKVIEKKSYKEILDDFENEYEDFGESERAEVDEFLTELITMRILVVK